MTNKTLYIVQPFELRTEGMIKAGLPMEVGSAEEAERIARRMAIVKAGAIAFSRDIEADGSDADHRVLIASFGLCRMTGFRLR